MGYTVLSIQKGWTSWSLSAVRREEHQEGDEPNSGLGGSFNHHLQLSFVDSEAETRAKLAYAPLNQECIFNDSHPFCTLPFWYEHEEGDL